MTRSVLLLTGREMDAHAAPGHPERPDRREAVAAGVREAAGDDLVERRAEPVDDRLLGLVHDPSYVEILDETAANGGGWIDPDTYLVRGSTDAARRAAGATATAALAVAAQEAEVAFAVVRPPGHHAAASRAGGFCLVNNVAVAVAALRDAGLAWRIGIVDWDVHHGDGTQELFEADADVWYGSTHQVPLYPGTGTRGEAGIGAAQGTKLNRPMAPGSGDREVVAAWRDELLPALEAFAPEAILVSAGYDAHADDPIAHLRVTDEGYRAIATELGAVSARLGLPGVALTLEGGYDLEALRRSAAATVEGLRAGRARAGT